MTSMLFTINRDFSNRIAEFELELGVSLKIESHPCWPSDVGPSAPQAAVGRGRLLPHHARLRHPRPQEQRGREQCSRGSRGE